MYPTLLEIGPFTVSSLWLCVAIGFFTALLIINKLVQKARLSLSFLADESLRLFFGGIIFSRLLYTISNNALIDFFSIWDRGFSPLGAVIGIVVVMVIECLRKKENTLQWLDILSIGVLGALIWGNLGTFWDGTNSGTPTDLPWGIVLQNSIYAVTIHPVQLYAALYCLILMIVFYGLYTKKWIKKSGFTSICIVGSYSVLHFLEEFLRGDETGTLFGIRDGFFYSIAGIGLSIIAWYILFKHPSVTKKQSKQ